MNLYDQNVGEMALLTPYRKQRFLSFMDEAFRLGWTFAAKHVSDRYLALTPVAVPTDPELSPEQRRNRRLIDLERLGIKFGVFRELELVAPAPDTFSARELPLPKKRDLLRDRLAALSA